MTPIQVGPLGVLALCFLALRLTNVRLTTLTMDRNRIARLRVEVLLGV